MFRRCLATAAAGTSRGSSGTPNFFNDAYKLSERVKRLGAAGQLEQAESEVKRAAKDAANVVVWNELIRHTLLARKYRRAWELWMDMKRRGVKPTTRSYTSFFTGLRKARKVEDGESGLARIKTIYAQWLLDADRKLKGKQPEDPNERVSNIPTNAYLAFLASIDNIPLLLETFNQMPTSGLLAPDSSTYSTVLTALLHHAEEEGIWEQAATIWKRAEQQKVEVDTVLSSQVVSLYREAPRPDDQKLGLALAERFYGLVSPEKLDTLVNKSSDRVKLVTMDAAAFSNVLALCLDLQKLDNAVAYFDQVRDYPSRFGKNLLDYRHCDLVLAAYAYKHNPQAAADLIEWMMQPGSKVKPRSSTFANALTACERTADFVLAKRLFDQMLSLSIAPSGRSANAFVSTAISTKDRGDMLQALDILEKNGFAAAVFPSTVPTETNPNAPHENKWLERLAGNVRLAIDRILSARNSPLDHFKAQDLADWRDELDRWLEARKSPPPPKKSEPKQQRPADESLPALHSRDDVSAPARDRRRRETEFDRIVRDEKPRRLRRQEPLQKPVRRRTEHDSFL